MKLTPTRIKTTILMKRYINYITLAIIMIASFGSLSLNAQTYSKEQMAVWQEVENKWAKWKAGDLDAAFANIDDHWLGWNDKDPMPISKEKWVISMKETVNRRSNISFDIEPARILVRGNGAVVHYYYSYSFLYTDGDQSQTVSDQGKWSEFFIKEGGKWILIGDFTTSNK